MFYLEISVEQLGFKTDSKLFVCTWWKSWNFYVHSYTNYVLRDFSLPPPPPLTFIYFAKCASDCKASSLSRTLPALNTVTSMIWALCVDIKLQTKKCSWSWNRRSEGKQQHLVLEAVCFHGLKEERTLKRLSPFNSALCPHVAAFPKTPLLARPDFIKEWLPAQKGLVPGQTPGKDSWDHQPMCHLEALPQWPPSCWL